MIKLKIITIACFSLLLCIPLFSNNLNQSLVSQSINDKTDIAQAVSYYSPELGGVVDALAQLPEASKVIKKIAQEGKIQILYQPLDSIDFGAMWDAERRIITVNSKSPRSLGSMICSVLFEMHNAISTTHFLQLIDLAIKGDISKNAYVRSVEQMEHNNCLDTVKLLEMGIARGIFPKDARWNIYTNFEDHYKVQQLTDHSTWIADNYERMTTSEAQKQVPYTGTVQGLALMSPSDKNDMLYFLAIKNDLESPDQGRVLTASRNLQTEFNKIEDCFHGRSKNEDCQRMALKNRFMREIFQQNALYASIAGVHMNQHPG